ncbi:unnamed protein product [Arctogadus glacialis]
MLLPCSLHLSLSLSLCVCARAPVCVSYVCLYRGKMAEKIALDSWRYAHYFELQSEKDKKNIVVKCNLCVGGKLLSTAFQPLLW